MQYKYTEEEVNRFKAEWLRTVAIAQYLLMIRGVKSIPIVSDGGKNRK